MATGFVKSWGETPSTIPVSASDGWGCLSGSTTPIPDPSSCPTYRLPYLLLALLALVGLALMVRSRPLPAGFVYWFVSLGSLFLVHSLIITSAPFRLPMEALVLPAALALSRMSALLLPSRSSGRLTE